MKKNLLFVFTDQWRRSSLGYFKDDPVLTPNMDEFARNSVVCTNSNSACPLCSPARASLLTGLYPLSTGVFTNCKTGSSIRLKDEELCISDVLKREGYQTGYIGKWHLDEPELNHTDKPSSKATLWDAFTPPGKRRHSFDFWYTYNASDRHKTPHYWTDTEQAINVNEWSPIHETGVAIEFIKNCDKNSPFCLYLAWNPPHSPYDTAPQKYKDMYKNLNYLRANVDESELAKVMHHTKETVPLTKESAVLLNRDYFAAVSGLDEQFGRLIKYLKDSNLFDDTIIVLTSDHGDMLTSHTLIGKHVWYEESVAIPFIIGGANLIPGITETVFSSQDVPVTLLSLLNVKVPSVMEGKDISLDIINHKSDKDSYTYLVACPGRAIFIEEFRKQGKDILTYGWRAIKTIRYTYVIEVGYETEVKLRYYLYDNLLDKYQMNPLIGKVARESVVAIALEEKLIAWLKDQNDGFVNHLK